MRQTLLYVIGVKPNKIGSMETFVRELACQMKERKWTLVACFEAYPSPEAKEFLGLPNVIFESLPDQSTVSWPLIREFVRIVLRHRASVLIYSYNSILRPYPWIAALLRVHRIFYNDHSSRPPGSQPRPATGVKKLIARLLTWPIRGSICVSKFVGNSAAVKGFLPAERITTIYNGIVLSDAGASGASRAGFRRSYRIPGGRKVVTQVSWIIPDKGVDKLLHAAQRVIAAYPEVQFVIAGEGEYRKEFQRLADTLEISGHVTWTGHIPRSLIDEGVYDAADIYCQMSQWEEAFGATIVEAMGASLPVIATKVGGIAELVEDGETGFLVGRDDIDGMARHILTLLRDDGLRDRMGRRGRIRAEQMFDVRQTAAAYLRYVGIGD